jgi:hypothetical protein
MRVQTIVRVFTEAPVEKSAVATVRLLERLERAEYEKIIFGTGTPTTESRRRHHSAAMRVQRCRKILGRLGYTPRSYCLVERQRFVDRVLQNR